MLIFDSKRGRFGTQKPKQWGSISSVRSAVFRNAERLGIDPENIAAIYPNWEKSGAVSHDIIHGNDNSTVDSWSKNGVLYSNTQETIDQVDGVANYLTNGFSFFATVADTAWYGYNFIVCGRSADRYYLVVESGYPVVRLGSAASQKSTTRMPIGVDTNIGFVFDKDTGDYSGFTGQNKFVSANNAATLAPPTQISMGDYVSNIGMTYRFNGVISIVTILSIAASDDVAGKIQENPYYLLNPTQRVTYIDLAPAGLQLKSPTSGTTVSVYPTLEWYAPTPTPTAYNLQVATEDTFASPVEDVTITGTPPATTWTPSSPLDAATEYFWRVGSE
jgi:hypothetical protein